MGNSIRFWIIRSMKFFFFRRKDRTKVEFIALVSRSHNSGNRHFAFNARISEKKMCQFFQKILSYTFFRVKLHTKKKKTPINFYWNYYVIILELKTKQSYLNQNKESLHREIIINEVTNGEYRRVRDTLFKKNKNKNTQQTFRHNR